jgi:hypothetical protein
MFARLLHDLTVEFPNLRPDQSQNPDAFLGQAALLASMGARTRYPCRRSSLAIHWP